MPSPSGCPNLSIPFWSDFICFDFSALCSIVVAFQSHFGLILSVVSKGGGTGERNFQSHFGLILSLHCRPQQSKLPFNPILVWFYQISSTRLSNSFLHSFNPILVWFYRGTSTASFIERLMLSIPFWSDFITERQGSSRWHVWRLLSIPFWSDFIQRNTSG